MAISIDLGSGAGSTNGDTLFEAFTKVNDMFSTTTKLGNGDLSINNVRVGNANESGSTTVGNMALNANTATGFENTAVGFSALKLNTNGDQNVAVGANALKNNVSGSSNVAIGNYALEFSTIGENVAIGSGALRNQTIGFSNTAVGYICLNQNLGGYENASLGFWTQEYNLNGYCNAAIGTRALNTNENGNYNTALGCDALYTLNGLTNSTGVGYGAEVSGSNQIQLGSPGTTSYAYGTVQNRSDLRDKTEVRDTVLGLDFINELRPVDYKWDMREDYRTEKLAPLNKDATEEEKVAYKILKDEWLESVKLDNLTHDGTHTRTRYHHGLIAQEVQDVIQASGVDFGGFQDHSVNGGQDVMSIGYTELIAPMIKAIQELTARINVLEGN